MIRIIELIAEAQRYYRSIIVKDLRYLYLHVVSKTEYISLIINKI